MLNHRLDQEQRDLEHRLEEAENQLVATGGAGAVANEGGRSCGDGSDARALQERLASVERELEAEQKGRLQAAEQLIVALDQLQEQGTTILSLTASLDRAVKQLADADARLDLTWSVQPAEDCQLTKSDLVPIARHDGTEDNDSDDNSSHIARLEHQLCQHIALNRRLHREQRDLELRLEEAENQIATHAATGAADSGRGNDFDLCALEERLVRTQCELETEQAGRLQVTKERQRLEEQLAAAHDDLIAAHRRLTGALRAQNDSAKLIARLRKS